MGKQLNSVQLILIGNILSISSRIWIGGAVFELAGILVLFIAWKQKSSEKIDGGNKIVVWISGILLAIANLTVIGLAFPYR